MESLQWIVKQLRALDVKLMSVASSLVEYVVISNTSADGTEDYVRFPGGQTKSQRRVRRVSPFGLVSRPPVGLIATVLKVGTGALNGLYVGVSDFNAAPQNLASGETCLYAEAGQIVYLDKDGNAIVNQTGSGTAQIGGNNYSMPKWDTFSADLETFLTSVSAATTAAQIATAAGIFKTAKAAASNYKSTKAKNG